MSFCDKCQKHDDCASGSGIVWPCCAYVPKVVTNADRIRSMSDDELAVLLSKPCECSVDPNEDGYRECGNKFCIEYLLNWLQQLAEPQKEE